MVDARDGAKVPVSIVYKKGFEKDGSGKLFLYAYGAYGHADPAGVQRHRISLLDRGWACAIAHIRGGDDLGHQWFLDGKLDEKDQHVQRFRDVAKGPPTAEFTRARADRDQRRSYGQAQRSRADGRSSQLNPGGRRRAVRRDSTPC